MGTSSSIIFYGDNGKPFLNIYRQYDGYPEYPGIGYDLWNLIDGRSIVNGFGIDDSAKNAANGMSDLAASVLAGLKKTSPLGNVYVDPLTAGGCEHPFQIVSIDGEPRLKIIGDRNHTEPMTFEEFNEEYGYCNYTYHITVSDGIPMVKVIGDTPHKELMTFEELGEKCGYQKQKLKDAEKYGKTLDDAEFAIAATLNLQGRTENPDYAMLAEAVGRICNRFAYKGEKDAEHVAECVDMMSKGIPAVDGDVNRISTYLDIAMPVEESTGPRA